MVQFNTIPGNIIAPIISFEVNSGGQFENQARLLLPAHKIAAGSASDNVPVPCPSTIEARAMFGAGSMLDDMVRLARLNAPAQEIWCVPVPATGTAEIRTITVDSVPAGGGQGVLMIAGRVIAITIAAGDTVNTVAAAINAAINGFYDELTEASLPVTSSVLAAVVTVTARHAGALMSEIDIFVPTLTGANAFLNGGTSRLTVAVTTPGAGDPDMSAALASLGDDPFDWMASPFGDATNIGRYKTLYSDISGRWAWNRQLYGHVMYPKTDSVANLTTHGLAQDNRHLSALPRIAGSGMAEPPWEWVAGFMARITPWLADGSTGNVSRNQTGLEVVGISPPRDRAKWLTYPTRDAFLRSGLSTWFVDAAGRMLVDKIITTSRTSLGVTDTTFRDIQAIGQTVYALRYIRTALTMAHGQKTLMDDNPGNLVAVTTPRDIAATFMHAYQKLERQGVLENSAIAAKKLIVKRNLDNANRVDIYAPIDRANPLDIIAANAVMYAQFKEAA